MIKKRKSKSLLNVSLVVLILALVFCAINVLGYSLAWFSNKTNIDGTGVTPYVNVEIYEDNILYSSNEGNDSEITDIEMPNINITPTSFNELFSKKISVKTTNTNIDTYLRIGIFVMWDNFEPSNNTLSFNVNQTNFVSTESSLSDAIDYGLFMYYKNVIPANSTDEIVLFDSIEFIGSNLYVNSEATIMLFAEVVQANSIGLDLFESGNNQLPDNWPN